MEDSSAKFYRPGGAMLAVSSAIFVLGIAVFTEVAYGDWDTSLGDKLGQTAARLLERWPGVRTVWIAEMFGSLMMSIAALLLTERSKGLDRYLSTIVWLAISVGSILTATSYAFTLGSYPVALEAYERQPHLFAAIRGGTLYVHAVGSILQLVGLLAVSLIELRLKARVATDRALQFGFTIAVLMIGASVLGWIAEEYIGAAVYLIGVSLGIKILLEKPGRES